MATATRHDALPVTPDHTEVDQTLKWLNQAERDAQRRVVTATPAAMASHLQELFGQRATAVLTGVGDVKTVGRWTRGQMPHEAHFERLMTAFHIVSLLEAAESAQVARAWMLGMNPDLNDRSPAAVLAEDPRSGGRLVMQAARGFLARG